MNAKILLLAITTSTALSFTSCNDDNDTKAKPVVELEELGLENSKTGYAGSDFHIEAEIIADAKIDIVTVEIHPEAEHEHEKATEEEHAPDEEWEVDSTYTKFSGLKNTTFHEHLVIPAHAEAGHYHFHFIVTDMEGNQTTVEEEVKIKHPDDAIAPEVNVDAAPNSSQTFATGESISISGSVSDDKALGGLYIGLVREDQNLTDAEVNATNTITLLHTHEFEGHLSHSFQASIEIGASQDNNISPKEITGDIAWQSANYYILVKCQDAFGGNWTYSTHYPVKIEL